MKSKFYKDYAAAAFKFFALTGKSLEYYKKQLYDQALVEANYFNSINLVTLYERKVNDNEAAILDINSVQNVLFHLEQSGKNHILRVLDICYFDNPNNFSGKYSLFNRVKYAANELFCDERTVYRHLDKALELFALERNLRV